MGLRFIAIGMAGFPFDLVRPFVADGYDTLVETGTYQGDTALKAADLFRKVHTIEFSKELYEAARARLQGNPRIEAHQGDSRTVMPAILEREKGKKLVFWLDAHYSGGPTAKNESPLIAELRTINAMTRDALILVDDARFINSPYTDGERYCRFGEFFAELLQQDRHAVCVDDKYVAAPPAYRAQVDRHCQEFNDWQWKVYLKSLRSKGFGGLLKRYVLSRLARG